MKRALLIFACMAIALSVQALDWKTIKANEKSMTEAQFDQFLDQHVEGKSVWWKGWVDDVERDGDSYRVKVDMDSPDTLFSVPEIWLDNVSEYTALRLKVDQKVTFSGQITDVSKSIYLSITIAKPSIR